MKILILISPPIKSGPVPQCMAIQAHQPDVVYLLQTLYPKQNPLNDQFRHIQAWIQGAKQLISCHPSLDEPYPVPITPPMGYQGIQEKKPELKFQPISLEALNQHILTILTNHQNDVVSFDFLPGGKEAKLQLMLLDGVSINLTYTTEMGSIIDLKTGIKQGGSKIPLPLIDRFWISGEAVFVEKTRADIDRDEVFLSALYEALSVETLTQRKADSLKRRRAKTTLKDSDYFDRPLTTFNREFREAFDCSDVSIHHISNEFDDVKFLFSDGREEVFFEEKEGTPNGTILEAIVTNQIHKNWNVLDSLTGISVIYPTREERENSYRNLTKKQFEENHLHERLNTFQERCDKVGLFWKQTSVEELMKAEFEVLKQGDLGNDEALKFIRQVELDTVCLIDSGVVSFDSKAFIRIGMMRKEQKAMQKPSSLFNNKNAAQYYVVASTSPPDMCAFEPVIHISQLNKGSQILTKKDKHLWIPSSRLANNLKIKFKEQLLEEILKMENIPSELLPQIAKVNGLEPDILKTILSGETNLSLVEIIESNYQDSGGNYVDFSKYLRSSMDILFERMRERFVKRLQTYDQRSKEILKEKIKTGKNKIRKTGKTQIKEQFPNKCVSKINRLKKRISKMETDDVDNNTEYKTAVKRLNDFELAWELQQEFQAKLDQEILTFEEKTRSEFELNKNKQATEPLPLDGKTLIKRIRALDFKIPKIEPLIEEYIQIEGVIARIMEPEK